MINSQLFPSERKYVREKFQMLTYREKSIICFTNKQITLKSFDVEYYDLKGATKKSAVAISHLLDLIIMCSSVVMLHCVQVLVCFFTVIFPRFDRVAVSHLGLFLF